MAVVEVKVPDIGDFEEVAVIELLVKAGDTKRIYVNGSEMLAGENTAPLPTDFTELFIGNSSNQAEAVSGRLDDVAFFSRELTPLEISNLATGASPATLVGPNDTDSDGLADAWELRFAANLTVLTAAGDLDTDGLSNADEFAKGTKPNNTDSDADGFVDGVETGTGAWVSASNTGTNPLIADTDRDGLNDGAETNNGIFLSAANAGTTPQHVESDECGIASAAPWAVGPDCLLGLQHGHGSDEDARQDEGLPWDAEGGDGVLAGWGGPHGYRW